MRRGPRILPSSTRRRRFSGVSLVLAISALGAPMAGAVTVTPAPTLVPANPSAASPAVASPAAAAPVAVAPSASVPITTIVAAARARTTNVYAKPGALKPTWVLDNRTNYSGRHVFVVVAREGDWFRVEVPVRPNGSIGYVRVADVSIFQHDFAITVSLSAHQLTLFKAGKPILNEKVAVGQARYPTPQGKYFLRELARPANPRGAYGPWAYGLSGYSNVLTRFGRGDGQLGLHGTNQPHLLGTDVSHGCIRISNAAITKMALMLPQGVPLSVVA